MMIHNPRPLVLASGSAIRLQLLRAAGVSVVPVSPRVDEDAIRASLQQDSAFPRTIADTLAEMKARKVAAQHPEGLVLGCDQVLDFDGVVWTKPQTPDEARTQLLALRDRQHTLLSALVLYDGSQPIWRHIGKATLTMRPFSDGWLDSYIDRNWDSIRHCVGGYLLEAEGIRLFSAIDGDYFTVVGLPLLPLLGYLGQRGFIQT